MEGYTCPEYNACPRMNRLHECEDIIRQHMSDLLHANEVLLTNQTFLDEHIRYEFVENMIKYDALSDLLTYIIEAQRC